MHRKSIKILHSLRLISVATVLSCLLVACGGGAGTTTTTRTGTTAGTTTTGTPSITSFTPTSATANTPTQFTIQGSSIPLTSVVSLSGGSCASPTNITDTGFLVLCTPGSTSGFATAIVNNNTLANGGYWIGQQTVTITAASSGVSLLTDTGITANQCYGAGSDALISCLSPAAIALNDKQDGMLGRDVTNSDSTDGWLGASYSISTSTVTVVSGTTTTITTTTDPNCLKDNVTGLTWQRASTTLTALRGNTQNDEAMGYRTTANTTGLCGFYDWRLPTPGELHSLLNYGSSSALYAIDMNWFPLTRSAWYITGTPYLSGNSANVWVDDFVKGRVDGISASGGSVELRLVR